ncbi:MAG: hypothetical protein ABIP57_07505 [Jatrophihabitantaceae bacterium]
MKKFVIPGVVAAVAGAAVLMTPTAALASGPYLNNNYATWTPANCDDITACNSTGSGNIYPANGTGFTEICYFDANYQMGNYWTNRYFRGYVGGHPGRWVVHASYVINQTSVGPC